CAKKGPAEREILLRASLAGHRRSACRKVFRAGTERADDGGKGPEQRDKTSCGYRARSHGADVRTPEIIRRHVRNQFRAGIEIAGEMRAEEFNGRHHHQPGKDAAGKDYAGNARSDDVADTKVLGRSVGPERTPSQPWRVVRGGAGPNGKHVFILEEGV